MSKELTKAEVEKVLTTDARFKVFKEKIRKLGYVKADAKKVAAVMEVTADFGMMSDAGNKKVARIVANAKNEADLRAQLDKLSKMAGGKYAEADEDEVFRNALDAMKRGPKGSQDWADNNILIQLRKFKDTNRDNEVHTLDRKKSKVKAQDAIKVHDILMKVRAPIRDKYIQLLQKDAQSFKKTFDAIASLKI